MGGFDNQRGRGLLPSPSNAPLLGIAPPQAFVPPGRGAEFFQHRMGNPWDSSSFRSGGPRGLSSGYYPSSRGRQDNSRKFLKAKRPQNKSSSSSSSTSKSGSAREGRVGGGRTKGSSSTSSSSSKSSSVKEKEEDKNKDSSSSAHSISGKQGDSPLKHKRSDKDEEEEKGAEEGKEPIEGNEGEEKMEEDGHKKDDDKNEDEKREREKPQEDLFPVEALYCHICELDSFSSKKGYIRHLQGITHAKMAEMFHAKNAATLELLNISAKLAEMRQRDKVLRRTGKKGQPVMKTTEQFLVQKWLRAGSCCGTKFKSPFGVEEHKLSIHHLKAKYTQKHRDEEKMEKSEEKTTDEGVAEVITEIKEEPQEVITEIKEEQFPDDSHDEVLRQSAFMEKAKKEAEEDPLTMDNLPVYDPSVMIGLDFITKELRFRCRICKIGQGFKSLENHCQSHTHFDNIVNHLNKIEDVKREEKRKKEEAEAEAKREQERLDKEKEEQTKKEKSETEPKMEVPEEEEEDGEGCLPSEYIAVDDCAKDKSDDEEMDEDAVLLGEEEERILNAKVEEEETAAGDDDEVDADDDLLKSEIFEEVGEKIDFDGDLKKQLENGEEEEEDEAEEEVQEIEPPQKKTAVTPKERRERSRGKGRWDK